VNNFSWENLIKIYSENIYNLSMKISIIGPGIMQIPPVGWGAVESLIWDYKISLEKLGHKVQIINIGRSE
jgi:hypothetical protein